MQLTVDHEEYFELREDVIAFQKALENVTRG
jgi:hypothetical protein